MSKTIRIFLILAVSLLSFATCGVTFAHAETLLDRDNCFLQVDSYEDCDFICCSLSGARSNDSKISYFKYSKSDLQLQESCDIHPRIEFPDNRLEIVPLEQLGDAPWNANLYLTDVNQKTFRGSGFLVGDKVALTAAHCATSGNAFRTGLRANSLVYGAANPQAAIAASEIIVPKAWFDSYDPSIENEEKRHNNNYDYAIVKFQDAFALEPFKFMSLDGSTLSGGDVNCCGYGEMVNAANAFSGDYLLTNGQNVDLSEIQRVGENTYSMLLSIKEGMSGGPVYIRMKDEYIAIGINVGEASSYNVACAIPESLGELVRWLKPPSGGSPSTGINDLSRKDIEKLVKVQRSIQSMPQDKAANGLSWAKKQNPEVVAWLCVPGTNVSLPVARHEGDDEFYLDHGFDGKDSPLGCVYMEKADSAGFEQPLSVLYGHSFSNANLMFTQLNRFMDPSFFEEHEYFYITTSDDASRYRIVEAAIYESCHISTLLDEQDVTSTQEYYDGFAVDRPDALLRNWRRTMLDASGDKMVQLSTCTIPANGIMRFVVTGVLCDD